MSKRTGLSRIVRTIIALGTLGSAQAATAAECLTEQEVTGLAIYAMPAMLDAVAAHRGSHLTGDGYFATHGSDLAARYRNSPWPPEHTGELIGFNMGLVEAKNPNFCTFQISETP